MTQQGQIKASSEDTMASAIRVLSMDAIQAASSSHPGAPMGLTDVATVLFNLFINIDPMVHRWTDRDRIMVPAGHGSMPAHTINHLLGYGDRGGTIPA